MAETLGERRFEPVVVAPSLHELAVDESPVRVRPRRDDAERDVVAGGRVVRQVHVVVDFFLALSGEDVVGFNRDLRTELALYARGRLMAVGQLVIR